MLGYHQIKDIITNKLGIGTLRDYDAYCRTFWQGRVITREDVQLLSPDNIDNNAFWRVTEELFGIDGVCNTMNGTLPNDQESGNRRNLSLARLMGALSFIDDWKMYSMPILEIGPGYGNFKSYVESNTCFKYTGVDCYPKIRGIFPTHENGLLPDYLRLARNRFHVVYSSNVFQHFSSKQRTQYYQDVYGMLDRDGIFIFNLMVESDLPNLYSEDGRYYLRHYGQFTEVPSKTRLINELQNYFYILYETKRIYDGLYNFVCSKKPLSLSTFKIDKTTNICNNIV